MGDAGRMREGTILLLCREGAYPVQAGEWAADPRPGASGVRHRLRDPPELRPPHARRGGRWRSNRPAPRLLPVRPPATGGWTGGRAMAVVKVIELLGESE